MIILFIILILFLIYNLQMNIEHAVGDIIMLYYNITLLMRSIVYIAMCLEIPTCLFDHSCHPHPTKYYYIYVQKWRLIGLNIVIIK